MKLKRLSGAAAMVALLAVLSPANAQARRPPPPDNWGQKVKSCNQTPGCYPGGTSRGGYVNGQAQDTEAPRVRIRDSPLCEWHRPRQGRSTTVPTAVGQSVQPRVSRDPGIHTSSSIAPHIGFIGLQIDSLELIRSDTESYLDARRL
jgi:hypothetical protein